MIEGFIETLGRRHTLTDRDVDRIRSIHDTATGRFLETLREARLVPDTALLASLGEWYELEYMETLPLGCRFPEGAALLPKQYLKTTCIVPIEKDGEILIAVHDPASINFLDDLVFTLGINTYTPVLTDREQILSAVNTLYEQSGDDTRQIVENIAVDGTPGVHDTDPVADLLDDTGDAPVIRLVNHMISQGVKARASDIHIEPFQEELKIRYRIDGILYEMLEPPKSVHAALVSRIKVMAKMNIAEKRIPQDGRAQVRLGNQEVDIRISTVPTPFGERLVMRLLNKSGYFLTFSEFGMSGRTMERVDRIFRQNNGIVLVTGPTGSGKTTTLYAGLSMINSPDKNILTIEDPIEYNLKGIGQIQVNTKTGLTFSKGLRSIVRQDPDVILIGEIRDLETAEIAIQSALTGHLVFSTLHTNDAAGAITRLNDLGVEPYLISSAVNTVIAQRLVRVLCRECKRAYTLGPEDVGILNGDRGQYLGRTAFRPKGCAACFNTGYSGRQAIFEIMPLDTTLKSLVLKTSDANRIRAAALESDPMTLRRDGMAKVLKGITSIEEVLRVTQD